MYQMTDPASPRRGAIAFAITASSTTALGRLALVAGSPRSIPASCRATRWSFAAVNLDRAVTAILARRPGARPNAQQIQDLAALVHLCGPGPADAFARSGFALAPGERCGDHDAATYLARVNAMKRQFLRLGAAT